MIENFDEITRVERDRKILTGLLDFDPFVDAQEWEISDFDIDVRDVVLDAREEVVRAIHAATDEISARRGLSAALRDVVFDRPAPCDPQIVATVRAVCDELGTPYLDMASGAYHDAMVLGAQVPIGMIFVPSRDGLSHHPDEYTEPAQLDLGVKVLAGTLAKLAA